MSAAIRIHSHARISAIAVMSMIGFVVLGFLPALIAGSIAVGGPL